MRGLSTHRASRHFRNYWMHFPDGFVAFQKMITSSWPDMEVELPEKDSETGRRLLMFCREKRISRELFWSGFGFQVWCQLLTHISRSGNSTLLIADEPDLYLHAEVQRQLVSILRSCNCDVMIATHSAEIIGEADPSELLMIDKTKSTARRLRDIEGVQETLEAIGSIHNITLSSLARTRRVLFVEGDDDYRRLRRFADRMALRSLAAGTGITAVESGGFSSWETVRSLAWGLKNTLGADLKLAAVYDRDYRCDEEVAEIESELQRHLKLAHLHDRKEIENYLLLPHIVDKAVRNGIDERNRRTGSSTVLMEATEDTLDRISNEFRDEAQSHYIAAYCRYFSKCGRDQSTLTLEAISRFNKEWGCLATRMRVVPGKEMLRRVRDEIQRRYSFALTDVRLIDSFSAKDIPKDLATFLEQLELFRATTIQ